MGKSIFKCLIGNVLHKNMLNWEQGVGKGS